MCRIIQSILQILVMEKGNVWISFFHIKEFFNHLTSSIIIRVDGLLGIRDMSLILTRSNLLWIWNLFYQDSRLNFLMIVLLCITPSHSPYQAEQYVCSNFAFVALDAKAKWQLSLFTELMYICFYMLHHYSRTWKNNACFLNISPRFPIWYLIHWDATVA